MTCLLEFVTTLASPHFVDMSMVADAVSVIDAHETFFALAIFLIIALTACCSVMAARHEANKKHINRRLIMFTSIVKNTVISEI